MADDGAFTTFDDAWEDGETGWQRVVGVVDEDVRVGAFRPIDQRSVDGFLNVSAVKVDGCAFWEIIKGSGEPKDVPEKGAGGCYLIDVPAWVDVHDFVGNEIKYVAVVGCLVVFICTREFDREWTGRGEGEVFGVEVGVAAGVGHVLEDCFETVIEWMETFPVVDKIQRWNLFLDHICRGRRVVDHRCFEVVILIYLLALFGFWKEMKLTVVSFLFNMASAMYGT
jgi:hypothetical protein